VNQLHACRGDLAMQYLVSQFVRVLMFWIVVEWDARE